MNIAILQLIEGARAAKGLTVVIDVFRAFSVACYAIDAGASRIIAVGELEKAYEIKRRNRSFVLMGERRGRKMPGFDYGNSPAEIEHVDLSNKTVILTTSAGTQGLVNASAADEIITGSFVNAQAIVNYIQRQDPATLSLVCMGTQALSPSDEDTLLAHYIKHILEQKPIYFQALREHLRECPAAAKFFDQTKPWAPQRDFELCMELNRYDFVLRAQQESTDEYSLTRLDGL